MQTPPAIAPGNVDLAAARRAVDRVLAEGRRVMTEPEAKALLAAYAVPVVRTEIAADPATAAEVAERIGFPVALKILSGEIQHKTDVGGVRLDLESAAAVEEAAAHMLKLVAERRPGAAIEGFTVQPMVPARRAHELVVGVRTDPVFGPVISFGQGGTGAELIADRAVGLPPLNGLLAREMIGRTEVSRLLAGYSDRPPVDLAALAATLVTLSQIVADFDEIAEIDINPLLADERGVVALDARIVLAPSSGRHRSRFAIQPYPGELEETVSTRSGTAFRLRPIRPEDEPGLVAMLERCDPEDVRLRFFAPVKTFGHAFAARLTQIDYSREMAFVGFESDGGPDEILGVARLIADPDEETAEFGIMVRSDQKGRGLGYLLMNAILRHATRRGLKTVTGEVLAENRSMLAMAGALGFRQRIHEDDVALRRVEIDVAAMMG
jgi:acetyltransferase